MDSKEEPPKTVAEDALDADYANNTAVEATFWDLKVFFGEYSDRKKITEWHTSITLPWAQAKLLAYYLKLNVMFRETHTGPLELPDAALPPEIPDLPDQKDSPNFQEFRRLVEEERQKFIQSLKK